ncbi:MAG: hypothetical protein JNM99_20410 [Verrucomicrobiaceae bacterium]|nr:hypothetical protein [Verrucomicrobiaceae bacterium]
MKTRLALLLLTWGAIHAHANLLTNGDFSQTYDPVGPAISLPTNWSGMNGSTENAGVFNGDLRFSTAGLHNANTHKYYVFQSFDAGSGGTFTLTFDYYLENANAGTLINGAKIAIDNWYVTASQALFSKTYMSESSPSAWHLNQTVTLTLTPGVHVIYLGTIGASQQNDQALVHYDNVSLEPTPPLTFNVTATPSSPIGGTVTGGGSYPSGSNATLIATASPGYYFVNWTEATVAASALANYTFTVGSARTLVANFAELPVMAFTPPASDGSLVLNWPSSLAGWILQESADLSPGSWVNSSLPITTAGAQSSAVIANPTGGKFFRLVKP